MNAAKTRCGWCQHEPAALLPCDQAFAAAVLPQLPASDSGQGFSVNEEGDRKIASNSSTKVAEWKAGRRCATPRALGSTRRPAQVLRVYGADAQNSVSVTRRTRGLGGGSHLATLTGY
jgi:hypothetical protein